MLAIFALAALLLSVLHRRPARPSAPAEIPKVPGGHVARVPAPAPSASTADEATVSEFCPGSFFVTDAQGAPLAGARVEERFWSGQTDDDGLVFAPTRLCGEGEVDVYVDEIQATPRVQVIGGETVSVVFPDDHDAVVVVVDEHGARLEGTLIGGSGLREIDEIEPGRWYIVGPGPLAPVSARVPGRPSMGARVTLDGEAHEIVVALGRTVRVDYPPGPEVCPPMYCDVNACVFVAPGEQICTCPIGLANMTSLGGLAYVPADAVEVRVDCRQPASVVTAHWTGALPCEAHVAQAGWNTGNICGADGSIRDTEGPGDYLVSATGADGTKGARVVHLLYGQNVDIGAISPGETAEPPARTALEVVRTANDPVP